MASQLGPLSADPSLINPDFIRRLQEQRVLHKREVAFHLAEAEKYGAADEALESMIQAAEKIVAIMFPAPTPAIAPPDQAMAETMSGSPSWAETAMTAVGNAPQPPAYNELPSPQGQKDLTSDDRAGSSGNSWRSRLLGGSS